MASKPAASSAQAGPAPLDTGATAIREIVVFLEGRGEAADILEFASGIAEEQGARLISVFVQPEPGATPAEMFARGEGINSVIDDQQARLDKVEAKHRAQFEDIVRRHGIRSEWRSLPHFSSEVGVHSYYADLVLIARPESGSQTGGPPGLAESLILSSGRPIILFPPNSKVSRVRRILVAWKASRESIRAVADALPLIVRAETVEVLVADPERDPTRHGQEPGADVARHLALHGAKVEVQRLSSGGEDVGQVVLARAAAFRADLLVMGAYGHSYLSEWMFGSVTRTIVRAAALPVLLSR
jgi:nucleotide-binding universal stress UspA family protein